MKMSPKRFLFRPAVEASSPLIPEEHTASLVVDDKGIVCSLQKPCQPAFLLLGRTLTVLFVKFHASVLPFSMSGVSAESKLLKALCILHIVTLSGLHCTGAHPIEHLRRTYLAAMLEQGFNLLVKCLRDVNPGVRGIGSRHVHLTDGIRLQSFCKQFGKG